MTPDIEDLIDKMTDVLQTNLESALAAVAARKSTPIDVQLPYEWIFGDKDSLPQMPCVIVTADTARPTKDENGYRIQNVPMQVEVYYEGDDVQTLNRIVRRYGAALDDILRANNRVPGFWQNISDIEPQYSKTLTPKNNSGGLFQAAIVQFTCEVVTN
ncbi:hypothetical protein ACOALA_04095 [Alicyclobacillus acidoterrestris]|uniref:hypothetical protein n=1 Tax=Alicyclobacillus acidoterrestris TaxID=1450 RepID=UPI003F53B970